MGSEMCIRDRPEADAAGVPDVDAGVGVVGTGVAGTGAAGVDAPAAGCSPFVFASPVGVGRVCACACTSSSLLAVFACATCAIARVDAIATDAATPIFAGVVLRLCVLDVLSVFCVARACKRVFLVIPLTNLSENVHIAKTCMFA